MAAHRKSFGSDNHAGAHDAILRMISEANAGHLPAYGGDRWTARATEQLRGLFGAHGGVYFVFNGTAANILGLSLLLRPFEAVICAESSHLNVDECGAAERVLGSKLLQVPAPDGKLTPGLVASRLAGRGDEHRAQPRAVAIAQVTELGTCYALRELHDLAEFCRASDLRLYLDGARLANAVAHLGCQLADIAGHVDVLSFGGTKNGALGDDSLWLRSASHANAMATRLAEGVSGLPGVELRQPVDSNAVFVALNAALISALQREWGFDVWDPAENLVRWMTAFDTTEEDVDAFVAAVRAVAVAL